MNGFLLDTNILSEFASPRIPNQRVDRWMKATPEGLIFTSVLTFAEIRRGIELLPFGKRKAEIESWRDELEALFMARLLPVTKSIGDRWAVLSAQAQRRGVPLGILDGLIAATAIEHDLTLATRNFRDFSNLGVAVVNPWREPE